MSLAMQMMYWMMGSHVVTPLNVENNVITHDGQSSGDAFLKNYLWEDVIKYDLQSRGDSFQKLVWEDV